MLAMMITLTLKVFDIFGIDVQTKKELLKSGKSVKSIEHIKNLKYKTLIKGNKSD